MSSNTLINAHFLLVGKFSSIKPVFFSTKEFIQEKSSLAVSTAERGSPPMETRMIMRDATSN